MCLCLHCALRSACIAPSVQHVEARQANADANRSSYSLSHGNSWHGWTNQRWCNFQCTLSWCHHDSSFIHAHPPPIHLWPQRSLTEQVKRRSFDVMVPIALVNLSDVTATIMPFPPSALCVFKILQLEKCKGGPNNVHKSPETSWGPTGVSHAHEHTYILTMHSLQTSH